MLVRTRTHLTQKMSRIKKLVNKYKRIFRAIEYNNLPECNQQLVHTQIDIMYTGITNEKSETYTFRNMFVIDKFFLQEIRHDSFRNDRKDR